MPRRVSSFPGGDSHTRLQGIRQGKKCCEDDRSNPNLVSLVETLGPIASGKYSHLKVVEIPDDVQYTIEEYDGVEWVAEHHRTWT